MKKNIGNKLALYSTPIVVVGAMNGEKTTWTLVAHIGIVSHDRLLVSLAKAHHINRFIKKEGKLSLNIVTEKFLDKADYCGIASGEKADKSDVFEYALGNFFVPLICESPLSIECKVEDIYDCNGFDNFVCSINGNYADETIIDGDGKLDYNAIKPVLFEFPTYQYLRTGDVIGHCTDFGKVYKNKLGKK